MKRVTTFGIAAGASLLAACAAERHPDLVDARMEYERTARDPSVQKNAAVALYEAEQTLEKAERQWEKDESFAEGEHDAYIVEKRLEIARAAAEREEAEELLEKSRDVRQEVVLEAREKKIDELARTIERLEAERTERGLVLTLGDVLFEVDEANLKPGAQQNLLELVQFLDENPRREVLVEGHTDSSGSDAYNRELSQQRAEAVEIFLTRRGISPARVLARGYGEQYPVAPNSTSAGRQENRRVEVVILDAGERAADNVLGMVER